MGSWRSPSNHPDCAKACISSQTFAVGLHEHRQVARNNPIKSIPSTSIDKGVKGVRANELILFTNRLCKSINNAYCRLSGVHPTIEWTIVQKLGNTHIWPTALMLRSQPLSELREVVALILKAGEGFAACSLQGEIQQIIEQGLSGC